MRPQKQMHTLTHLARHSYRPRGVRVRACVCVCMGYLCKYRVLRSCVLHGVRILHTCFIHIYTHSSVWGNRVGIESARLLASTSKRLCSSAVGFCVFDFQLVLQFYAAEPIPVESQFSPVVHTTNTPRHAKNRQPFATVLILQSQTFRCQTYISVEGIYTSFRDHRENFRFDKTRIPD